MKHLIALILSIPQALMAGLVFSKSWNWFIVRKFESMPRLGTLDAVGILFVTGLVILPFAIMMGRRDIKEKHPDKDDGSVSITISLIMSLIVYPLLLGIAALWHLVIG